jgi:hypothetical protein
MQAFETPTYYLDVDHGLNRATLESAKQNKPMTVLVRAENDRPAPPIKATGILVGPDFHVEVVTAQGKQCHTWTWAFLCDALAARRN